MPKHLVTRDEHKVDAVGFLWDGVRFTELNAFARLSFHYDFPTQTITFNVLRDRDDEEHVTLHLGEWLVKDEYDLLVLSAQEFELDYEVVDD